MKKYKVGEILKGKISGIEPYGAFIELDNKMSGLVHISEISTRFVNDLHDYFELDETIYVKVIGDKDKAHLNLSIKDIDYKYGDNKKTIKEEGEGFLPLAHKRSFWIKEKIEEINRK